MIEEMYLHNLNKIFDELEGLSFSDVLRRCRSLFGLKQYAAADFLGIEKHRYKKIEMKISKGQIEEWELERLGIFYSLPQGFLQRKLDEVLKKTQEKIEIKEIFESVWSKKKVMHEGNESSPGGTVDSFEGKSIETQEDAI